MQQFSVCPGCGRLIRTRYPFMRQSGRTVMEFCLASCFVTWDREHKWRQHQTSVNSVSGERQATLSARAFDDRWQMRTPQTEPVHAQP